MKAITVRQPWASLIILGAKPYEFRDRSYLTYINHSSPARGSPSMLPTTRQTGRDSGSSVSDRRQ
jgi:hypothetical protein